MGPRPHLAMQVLLTVLAVAGGLAGLDRGVTTRLPVGSPAGQVQVIQLLDSLPAPGGAVRDPYATACGIPSRFCISSAAHGPSAVAGSVVDLLRRHGARVVDHECDSDEAGKTCVDKLVVDGVGIEVRSSDRGGPGVTVPSYAAVVIPSHAVPQLVGAPLPPLALLRLAPPKPAVVPCLERKGAGCLRYEGAWVTPGSAESVEQAWRTGLLTLGYRLRGEVCESAGTGSRCSVEATKFRTFGGLDPVHVTFSAADVAPGRARAALRVATVGAVTTP